MKWNTLLNNRDRLSEVAIFLLLLINYAYFFPRWADPNQNSRLDMVVAVVDQGTFQIDHYVDNTVDYAKVGEHYYSDKAPGTAFLGIPVYAGLKLVLESPILSPLMDRLAHNAAFQATLKADGSGIYTDKVRFAISQVVLTFLISILPSAFLGVWLVRVLRKLTGKNGRSSGWLQAGIVLIYGLLTPAFAYSGAFYGHQLAAAILFAVFYGLFRSQEKIPGRIELVWIGFLLGLSIITEYPTVLIAAVLFVYLLFSLGKQHQWQRSLWAALGGIVPIGAWMAYNAVVFGGPLSLGYSYSTQWQTQHHTGFMSLTIPHWDAVWGLTFGVFRGLFILSPVLLLAIPGFIAWWQSRRYRAEFWVSAASLGLTFLFNSSSSMWWGGFAVGPRYLLPALPFLILPFAIGLLRWWRYRWFQAAVLLLTGWSWVATWGLSLAGQSFPPDSIQNPLVDYALKNWVEGNIARNLGTILGIKGAYSLIPLVFITLIIITGWITWAKEIEKRAGLSVPAISSKVLDPLS